MFEGLGSVSHELLRVGWRVGGGVGGLGRGPEHSITVGVVVRHRAPAQVGCRQHRLIHILVLRGVIRGEARGRELQDNRYRPPDCGQNISCSPGDRYYLHISALYRHLNWWRVAVLRRTQISLVWSLASAELDPGVGL